VYKRGYRLKTDAEFDNAIYFGLIVSITQDEEYIGSGHLNSHNNEIVKLNEAGFFKNTCEFMVCL
jgi:hypothetical protein